MIPVIITTILDLIGRVIPDKGKQAEIQLELAKMAANGELKKIEGQIQNDLAQAAINQEQAKSTNIFVSGARPLIMWGLGIVLVLYFLLSTVVAFAISLGYEVMIMPPLDPMIRDIVLGLLGLGWVSRSYEKVKGIQ